MIYARYSTDEQNPRSISDQVDYVKRFLAEVYEGEIQFTIFYDEGISGEVISRPGIDKLKEAIFGHECDLVIGEDASRFYRDERAGFELAETTVDEDIRFICINDRVDTAEEEEWQYRLHDALRHHAECNRFTCFRIKRALDSLWLMGAAIGLLRTGYLRDPSTPATKHDPAEGPFFDKIDPQWTATIQDLYERVARKDPLWQIVPWLNQTGLPKTSNARKKAEWTEGNIVSLIRRMVYKGLEEYRKTVSKKRYRTGKRKPKRNKPESVLVREMPHLRIVSDQLWIEANRAIDERVSRPNPPTGQDHPLHDIPRDSRGPLSGILVCEICGGKMHASGRNEGGYQCSLASRGSCWNKATTLKAIAHSRIANAILAQLPVIESRLEEIIRSVQGLLVDDEARQARKQELETLQQIRNQAVKRLLAAIETTEEPPEQLVRRMAQLESEQEGFQAELEQIETETHSVPTHKQLAATLQEFSEAVQKMGRETRPVLNRVVSSIRAVPFRQFGSTKVVLRARFEINVSGFLPYAVLSLLRNVYGDGLTDRLGTIPISVDLFEMSSGPQYGLQALKIHEESGGSLKAVEIAFGINKRKANIAVNFGRTMRAAGMVDPYLELTERPSDQGRWRYRGDRPHPAV